MICNVLCKSPRKPCRWPPCCPVKGYGGCREGGVGFLCGANHRKVLRSRHLLSSRTQFLSCCASCAICPDSWNRAQIAHALTTQVEIVSGEDELQHRFQSLTNPRTPLGSWYHETVQRVSALVALDIPNVVELYVSAISTS